MTDFLILQNVRNKQKYDWGSSSNFVGNKAKGQISKWVLQEKQSTTNFPKNEHFVPSNTHMYVRFLENVRFSENLMCFVFFKHMF